MFTNCIIFVWSFIKKNKFTLLSLLLFFVLLWIGGVIYQRFVSICHNNDVIYLKTYGPIEFFCDSIDLELVATVPRYDSGIKSYQNRIIYHNKQLKAFYYYKERIIDSMAFAGSYNRFYKWLDRISLSDNEVQDIQKNFFHNISDSVYKQMKGALLVQFIHSENKNYKTLDNTNVRQQSFKFTKDVLYEKSIPRSNEHEFINTCPTKHDDITDKTSFIWDINGWEKHGATQKCEGYDIPGFIKADTIRGVSCIVSYKDEHLCNNFLIEISPWESYLDTVFVKSSHITTNKWLRIYDLSQEAMDIYFDISTNPPIRKQLRIKQFAIPFEKYTDFTYIFPHPDSIGDKIIFYTDRDKIQQIIDNGFHAFVKYPEMQNEQTARIFALTMIMTLLVTGFLNQIIKLFKDGRIRNKFTDKTKLCALSAMNCMECPLKSQCEHFKQDE